MKNWKKCSFFGFLAFIVMAFAFIACDNNGNGKNNDPECDCPNGTLHTEAPCDCPVAGTNNCNCKYQYTQTINLQLGPNSYTVVVKGTLTTSQWEGLAVRIENVLQNSVNLITIPAQANAFLGVFMGNKALIVVEKDADFNRWFVINKYLVNFDFDYLAGQSDESLTTCLLDIIMEMETAPFPAL